MNLLRGKSPALLGLVTLSILLAVLVISPAHAQDCPDSMTHYWMLDETSGPPFVDSIGSADATCPSACPDAITGLVNGAQYFDGGDKVDIPDDGTFNWGPSQSFSIELWIRKNTSCVGSSNSYNNIIIGRYDGSSGNNMNIWWLGVNCNNPDGTSGAVRFVLRDDAGGDQIVGNTVVTDGEWHHIVAIRDNDAGVNGENRLYVDGVLQGTVDIGYTYGFACSRTVNVGYLNFGAFFYLDGDLDELATYDRALTDTEILTHYDRGINDGEGYCNITSPPTIITIPVTDGMVGRLYEYDVDATGQPAPTYSLITYPAGMTIDPVSGLISWTPSVADDYSVVVEALSTSGTDQQAYTLSVAEEPNCPDGLVHYWFLDEAVSGTYEDVWSDVDIWCSGASCPTPATGIVGDAQYFDGTDNANVDDYESFNWGPDDNFTIEFWMDKDTDCSGSTNNVILGRYGSGDFGLSILWLGVNCNGGDGTVGAARFVLRDQSGTGVRLVGDNDLIHSGWHHMAAVRDADLDSVKLYVDGDLQISMYYDFGVGFYDTTEVDVGYLDLSGGFKYSGTLDELAVYGRALSAEEIYYHYQYGTMGLTYCDDGFDPEFEVLDTEPPGPVSTLTSVDIRFTDDRGLDVGYYQIDGCTGPWTAIWSGSSEAKDTTATVTLPTLGDGQHHLYFKIADDFEKVNGDSCSNSWSFVIDATPPEEPVVTSPASGMSLSYLPTLGIDISDAIDLDRAYYQIDGCSDDWIALWDYNCGQTDTSVSLDVLGLGEGYHEVFFKVIDDAGNINADSCSASWEFTYDITPPSQPIVTSPNSGRYFNYMPVLRMEFQDELGLSKGFYQEGECTGDWIELWAHDCAGTDTSVIWTAVSDYSEGIHTYFFKSVDDAGNVSVDTCSYSWNFIYDVTPPESPTDFTAGSAAAGCFLIWKNPGDDPTFVGVEIKRNKWAEGAYPEYDDAFPVPEGYPASQFEGTLVYRSTGEFYFDAASLPRNVYYYSIFSYDEAGNYSELSAGDTARSTNYILGDISADGFVDSEDTVRLADAFGSEENSMNYDNEVDIGPTLNMSAYGIPTTDNRIDFEDLMVLAVSFGQTFPRLETAGQFTNWGSWLPVIVENDPVSKSLAASVHIEPGYAELLVGSIDTFWVQVEENLTDVKGSLFKFSYDESYLQILDVVPGNDFPTSVFFRSEIHESDSVLTSLAVLDGSFAGPGELIGLVVEALNKTEDTRLNFARSTLRGSSNQTLSHNTSSATIRIRTGICGDSDGSLSVDIDDVVHLINYIFGGGPAPEPLESGDADCSGNVDIDDVVYLINFIFGGGPMPCDPDGDQIPDC
jgi:hypothetical protein